MKRTVVLNQKVEAKICAGIRAGAFPHVAAESAGVPQAIFDQWIIMGTRRKPKQKYKTFVRQIAVAKAQARLVAEMAVLAKDPKTWLRCGPGRETTEERGWTNPVQATIHQDNHSLTIMNHPQIFHIFSTILKLLEPWPEAKQALAQAFLNNMVQPPALAPPK